MVAISEEEAGSSSSDNEDQSRAAKLARAEVRIKSAIAEASERKTNAAGVKISVADSDGWIAVTDDGLVRKRVLTGGPKAASGMLWVTFCLLDV